MSADNGIYVLRTAGPDGVTCEYRVTEAQNIEDLTYDVATNKYRKDFIPERAFAFFRHASVFSAPSEAFAYAFELAEKAPILEYGVSMLDHTHQTYPSHLTEEDLERYEVEVDKTINRIRGTREQELQRKRAEAEVEVIPNSDLSFTSGSGEKFVPILFYGYLHTQSGEQIHGAVRPLPDGSFRFLPSDWSKSG